MSAITIGGIVFAVVFGGALLGMRIRAIVPEDHLSHESRDVIKLGMGLIGTMAALVLSLLISSAKTSFDTRAAEVTQVTANVIVLDRLLAHYGAETKEARDLLRRSVVLAIAQLWPEGGARPELTPDAESEALGLFVHRNTTVTVALFVCALAFSSAIFLVLELDQPFEGVIRISSTPMRQIVAQLGR